MTDIFKGIITADGKKRQLPYNAVFGTPASDPTLSLEGAFADSKAVGDKFKEVKVETDSLKEDITSKADKTSLVQTNRKLDALWKLNQGISYEFQTDEAEAYQKTVPSGTKMASVKQIGGKTIVWNQLLQPYTNYAPYDNAHTKVSYEDDCAILTVIDASAPNRYSYGFVYPSNYTVVPNHKYYISASLCASKECTISCEYVTNFRIQLGSLDSNTWTKLSILYTPTDAVSKRGLLYMDDNSVGDTLKAKNMMLVDLTKMFGSGNEPSTPKEFEAMFPVDYYPYNAGELMSAPVNEVTEQGKNLLGGKAFADKIVELGGTLDEANGKVSIAASVISDKTVFEFPDESKSYTIILSGENTNTNLQSTNLKTDKGACNRFVDRCSITTVTGVKKIFGAYDTQIVIYDYEKCGIFEGVLTADDFKPYHKTSYPIPQAVLNLPGYGWSTGNVRNEVDFENKKYIQRVGKYVITDSETFMTTYAPVITFLNKRHLIKRSVKAINNQGLSIFSANEKGDIWQFLISDIGLDEDATVDDIKEWFKVHPVTSYYPMLNEEITDISDIIGNTFQEPLEVEAGGTLTFRNSHGDDYRIPVPNSEEYVISLAEVAK